MIKTEEILIKGAKSKKTICDILIYEPENIEEASLGNLYLVAELKADQDSSHLINLLSSLVKREYYSAPHRGPLNSLEVSLKKANLALSELTTKGNSEWLGKLHFICAVLNKEKDLYLSQSGSAKAYLCREGSLTDISRRIVPPPQKPHPAKTFQSVISGQVETTDKLIFCTPSLFNFFTDEGLRQIFTLPKIELISDQVKKILREQKKLPSLAALLLEIIPKENQDISSSESKDFITPPIKLQEILK